MLRDNQAKRYRNLLFGSLAGTLLFLTLGTLADQAWLLVGAAASVGALVLLLGRGVALLLDGLQRTELTAALVVGVLMGLLGIALGDLHGSLVLMLLSEGAGGVAAMLLWPSVRHTSAATRKP